MESRNHQSERAGGSGKARGNGDAPSSSPRGLTAQPVGTSRDLN